MVQLINVLIEDDQQLDVVKVGRRFPSPADHPFERTWMKRSQHVTITLHIKWFPSFMGFNQPNQVFATGPCRPSKRRSRRRLPATSTASHSVALHVKSIPRQALCWHPHHTASPNHQVDSFAHETKQNILTENIILDEEPLQKMQHTPSDDHRSLPLKSQTVYHKTTQR